MIGYDPSYLNETETLLEEFHKIQKYLIENPIYKIYQADVDYVTNVNEYYITDVTTRSGDMLGVGDVVLFRNVYYGVITEINEDTQMFTIAEGISFRGATGARGLRGEIGATGATGATGANGLEYLGEVVQFEYDGDEFDEPLTFNNSDFNRTPTINDGFLFMYHLNESNLSYIVNGRVTAVGTDTCRVTISPQARQAVTGPVGPVGVNGLSIYLYDGEITSTTTTATTSQVEVPTGRTLQVYDILFSTYETTYGAMAEVTEIQDTGLRVDYIGQVASAGGGFMPTYMDIGANIRDVAFNESGIRYESMANELSDDNDVMVECFQNITLPITAGVGIEFVEEDNNTVSINATGGGGGVSDVQVNGTSIVSDGVANIPLASATEDGMINSQNDTQVLGGTKTIRPKSPNNGYVRELVFSQSGGTEMVEIALSNTNVSEAVLCFEPTARQGKRISYAFTSNGRRYFGASNTYDVYIGLIPSTGQIAYRPTTASSAIHNSTLPAYSGTFLSAPATWSTGTSGSVTLASAGLYEVKVTKTFGEYDTDIVAFINFAKDGTKGAISTTMSFVGTSGLSTGFIVVDPTGVMTFFDTMVGEGDTSVTLSYRKIGIA